MTFIFSPSNAFYLFAFDLFLFLNSSAKLVFLPLASLFFLPLVFVFMFVGELVSMSESLFVFVEVALLVALFEIDGLFVLVIPGKKICL